MSTLSLFSEFISSMVVSASVPTAVFFSFRLHKGNFDKNNFGGNFDTDGVIIDKRNLFFLILAILGTVTIIPNI